MYLKKRSVPSSFLLTPALALERRHCFHTFPTRFPRVFHTLQEGGCMAEPLESRSLNEHFIMLGRLASSLTHEIRSPLALLFLLVETLEEELWHPRADSHVQLTQSVIHPISCRTKEVILVVEAKIPGHIRRAHIQAHL